MSIFLVRAVFEAQLMSYGLKHACNSLSKITFVRTYTHNLKTTGCIRTFYIWNVCSTIEDAYFWVRVACKIQLVSYGSKHASESFSDTLFARTCTQLGTYLSYMDVLHIEWLLDYWRHFFVWFVELHKRSDGRAMTPDTHQWFYGTTLLWVPYKPIHTSLFGAQLLYV